MSIHAWKWRCFVFVALLLFLPTLVLAQEMPLEPVDLRVMTFNIWLGGDVEDFGKVVEAIQAADADIVGLQEATGNTRRLADALGWQYASERMQIISRFPLIDPPDGNGIYIFAQIRPGQIVALANVHLPSGPYGPDAVRDGSSVEEVLELERTTRLPAIQPQLQTLPTLIADGIPVFLTGDFNAPSHWDWTEAMSAVRDQVKFPIEWPVSLAVEAAGFQDTYRAIHPDPVAQPGITWTYGYPYPRLKPAEVVDRIDFVFASQGSEALDSQVIGEGPDADIQVAPYPSDHRAVVSTVRVTPAVPPLFVAADRRVVSQGEGIVVRYHAPDGEDTDRIVLVPSGGNAINEALMWLPPYEASFFGSVTFGSAALTPGEYDAVLIGADDQEISRTSFWVVKPYAVLSVSVERETYKQGEAITVTWQNAPALRWDWVGIYAAGDPDLYNDYLGFIYTQASVTGSTMFDADALGEAMLPPGDYVVRLMKDDGYEILATASFTITD